MSFQKLETGTLDVFNPILGGALNIPAGFWEPGSLSAYKGHFGTGAVNSIFCRTCGRTIINFTIES